MIVRCTNCNSAYSVDDEKVSGKRFAFGCPKCSANVIIDNRGQSTPAAEEQFSIASSSSVSQEISDSADDSFNLDDAVQDDSFSFGSDAASEASFDAESFLGEENDNNEFMASFDADEAESTPFSASPALSDENEDFSLSDIDTTPGFADLDLAGDEESTASFLDEIHTDDELDLEPEIDISLLGKNGESSAEFADLEESDLLSTPDFSAEEPIDEDDEKITIDLEKLDLPFEDDNSLEDEKISMDLSELPIAEEENEIQSDDESITLDLDSLDLDLAETPEMMSGITPESGEEISAEDESLTLDLDSLDLDLAETPEMMSGESPEEAGRLSLEDAGISFDEFESTPAANEDEMDLHLNLSEIASDIDIDQMATSESGMEDFGRPFDDAYSEANDLPELDLDSFDASPSYPDRGFDDTVLELSSDYEKYESEITSYGETSGESGSGYINFSIDYSIKYSRFGALLRILGLFNIVLIPHFLILIVYSLLSAVLTPLNQLLVLVTGNAEKDYILIHEKALRYSTALSAVSIDLIEELPQFGGGENMDYPLQMNIVRPSYHSRLLAFLRLTGVGILVAALPHLILLMLLSFGAALLSFFGLLSVLFIAKWPSMLFDFMIRYYRYCANISAYLAGDIDTYPSFRFD